MDRQNVRREDRPRPPGPGQRLNGPDFAHAFPQHQRAYLSSALLQLLRLSAG